MLKKIALTAIGFYQNYIRIALPYSCRFWPTCSEYTQQAITKYGVFKGIGKGLHRLLLCHPLSGKAGDYPLQ